VTEALSSLKKGLDAAYAAEDRLKALLADSGLVKGSKT